MCLFVVLKTGPGACLQTTNASTFQKTTVQGVNQMLCCMWHKSDYSHTQTLATGIKNMNNVYCDLQLPPCV
jgi:hypothetical protein